MKLSANKIALSGVLAAAAIVVMLLASLIGVGTYAGPLWAAAVLLPVRTECGMKTALGTWFAVSLLCFMVLPDRELALFWICFGWYPVILPLLEKIKPRIVRMIAELGIYAVMIFVMYGILMRVLGIDPDLNEARIVNIIIAVIGAAAFLLLESFYKGVEVFYKKRLKRK